MSKKILNKQKQQKLINRNLYHPYYDKECNNNCNFTVLTTKEKNIRVKIEKKNGINEITIKFLKLLESSLRNYTK